MHASDFSNFEDRKLTAPDSSRTGPYSSHARYLEARRPLCCGRDCAQLIPSLADAAPRVAWIAPLCRRLTASRPP